VSPPHAKSLSVPQTKLLVVMLVAPYSMLCKITDYSSSCCDVMAGAWSLDGGSWSNFSRERTSSHERTV